MNPRILTLVLAATAALPAAEFLSPLGGEQTVASAITTPGRTAPIVGTSSDVTADLNRAWAYWSIAGYGRFYGLMPPSMAARLAGAPPSYLVADYNGDGCQDILVVNRDAGQDAMVWGSSDGSLADGGSPLPTLYCGKQTGAPLGFIRDHERPWMNLYSPVTGSGATSTTTVGQWQVRTGDFNGDGMADVLAQSVYEDKLHILLSKLDAAGKHSFADAIEVPRPAMFTSWAGYNSNHRNTMDYTMGTEVEVADFDNDGKTDLMVRGFIDNETWGASTQYGKDRCVQFLISKGDGSFDEFLFRFVDQAFKDIAAGHIYCHNRYSSRCEVRILDANGDGLPDLKAWEWHGVNDGEWDSTLMLNAGKRAKGEPALLFKAARDDDGRAWERRAFPYVEGSPTAGCGGDWGMNLFLSHKTEAYFADMDGDGSTDLIRRETHDWTDAYGDTDAAILYQENGGGIWCFQPRAMNLRLSGQNNGGSGITSRTNLYGNMLLFGDIDGDARADVVSWQNGPDRDLKVFSPGRKRGAMTEKEGGITLPASSELHNLLMADINGDGKQELVIVRNAAGLPMQVYQAGAWYEESLHLDAARGKHQTSQAVESVVVMGKPMLFKRHAEPGKADGNLAWTTTREDGSWLPWSTVKTLDDKPVALLDRPFSVVDDGLRLLVTQRTANDEFTCRRFLFRSGGGDIAPTLEQYQEVVFNGSGTTTPINDDDTLTARPEAPWKFSVGRFFNAGADATPSLNIQNDAVGRMVGQRQFIDNGLFDLTFVSGAAGQRMIVALPRTGGGLLVTSLRTVDGQPAPRGREATPEQQEPQYYNREGSVQTDGSIIQAIIPDGAASYVAIPGANLSRPSLAGIWSQDWQDAKNPNDKPVLMRTALALKVATTNDQPDGTTRNEPVGYRWVNRTTGTGIFRITWPAMETIYRSVANLESVVSVQHIPLDVAGIPAAVNQADGSLVPMTSYADPKVRTVPYLARHAVRGGGLSAPRLYQGVDGYAHVLVGRGNGVPASQGGMLELMLDTVTPPSIPDNRRLDSWAGTSYTPALVPNSGWWSDASMCVGPGQLRGTMQPAVIEFAISRRGPRGLPQGAMWRSVVGSSPSDIFVSRPKKLTSLEVMPLGFALINPKMVGVIESAPPLPPAMVAAGGKTAITLQSMSSSDYEVGTSSSRAGRFATEGKAGAFAWNIEGGGGTSSGKTWGVSTGQLEATTLQSTSRPLEGGGRAMRQLGQAVFLGDKAEIQSMLIPGTGRCVGIFLVPIPGQTLTRVYPFGIRKSFLDLSNWGYGTAELSARPAGGSATRPVTLTSSNPGYVLAQQRMNEEVRWTNQLKAERKRTLTLNGGKSGFNQARTQSDAEMQRRTDLGGLRNTYQWTAYGGFRAATEERSNRFSYDFTGFGDVSVMVGFTAEGSFGAGLGAFFVKKAFEITALGGFQGEWSDTKTESSESGRGMEVTLDIDTDAYLDSMLNLARQGAASEQVGLFGAPIDAIEFTTFYLPKSMRNYGEFYGKVLSPAWLKDPRAPGTTPPAIVRDAQQNLRDNLSSAREIWRIAHRVTMVSRLYQDLATGTDELK